MLRGILFQTTVAATWKAREPILVLTAGWWRSSSSLEASVPDGGLNVKIRGQIRRNMCMEKFISESRYLEVNAAFYWEPMKRMKSGV